MTGSTIDHLVSVTVFLGAILLFISLFNQTIQTAILYQRHRYLATKCSDLLDNILLNSGNWNGSIPTSFGLQEFNGYRLSSFSLMRLLSSAGDKVYYNLTGEWYSNVSWGLSGGYLLLPESDCINYSTASKLLGVNGTYGFQLIVAPIVSIDITEIQLNPLKLEIKVVGPGLPLSEAKLDYLLFWTTERDIDGCPLFNFTSGNTSTNSAGLAYLDFSANPRINVANNKAYTIIVKSHIGGLYGVGYKSRETITSGGNIIPFVESYENGTVLLAHKWGKNDPDDSNAAVFFNATFYLLPDNFAPIKVDITNSTGHVTYGQGFPFQPIQIPTANPGFLVVSYCKSANEYGMVVMPWGISTIGISVVFGGDPSGNEWVATDMRQVLVGDIAYQAKLALWSLQGYQVIG